MTDGIQFNEENFEQNAHFETKGPKFAQLLIKWGLAKDENGANIVLISVSVIFLAVSIFLFLRVFGVFNSTNSVPTNRLPGIPFSSPTPSRPLKIQ